MRSGGLKLNWKTSEASLAALCCCCRSPLGLLTESYTHHVLLDTQRSSTVNRTAWNAMQERAWVVNTPNPKQNNFESNYNAHKPTQTQTRHTDKCEQATRILLFVSVIGFWITGTTCVCFAIRISKSPRWTRVRDLLGVYTNGGRYMDCQLQCSTHQLCTRPRRKLQNSCAGVRIRMLSSTRPSPTESLKHPSYCCKQQFWVNDNLCGQPDWCTMVVHELYRCTFCSLQTSDRS